MTRLAIRSLGNDNDTTTEARFVGGDDSPYVPDCGGEIRTNNNCHAESFPWVPRPGYDDGRGRWIEAGWQRVELHCAGGDNHPGDHFDARARVFWEDNVPRRLPQDIAPGILRAFARDAAIVSEGAGEYA